MKKSSKLSRSYICELAKPTDSAYGDEVSWREMSMAREILALRAERRRLRKALNATRDTLARRRRVGTSSFTAAWCGIMLEDIDNALNPPRGGGRTGG